MSQRVKAYAKLNLTLAVTGEKDGYHTLDSVVCTVDLFDLIKLSKRKDGLVSVRMFGMGLETLAPEENNAYKAAQAYIKAFDCGGVDIKIYKNIPVGAGMGGSSADVAGVLRGMSKLYGYGSEAQLKAIADSLGSDCGYLLSGGFARLYGRGEIVEKLRSARQLNFLALVPKGGVSTAECFRAYLPHGEQNTADTAVEALKKGDLQELGGAFSNSLLSPAEKLNADILTAFEELKSFSPCGVGMTGSGSAVFALFESGELCDWAKSRYRGRFECIKLKTVEP